MMKTRLSLRGRLAILLVAVALAWAPLGVKIAARAVAGGAPEPQRVAVNWNSREIKP